MSNTSRFLVISSCIDIQASTADWYILGKEFKFHCHPYFLRLNFPGSLVEDGRERATYDIDKGEMIIYLPKLEAGNPLHLILCSHAC